MLSPWCPRSCLERIGVKAALLLLVVAAGLRTGPFGQVHAGIPEPDLVWYGRVMMDSSGNTIRLTSGTLAWRIEPVAGGPAWVVSTPLTNINDQFSFLLRIPCESPEPGASASTNRIVLTTPAASYRRLTATLDGQPLTIQGAATTFSPSLADRGTLERIDLFLGTPPSDSDGDGLPDSWEQQYFGSATGADPAGDADGDGLSNAREFRAGTHPLDPQSVFEIIQVTPVTGGLQLTWSSVAGKSYRVRRSSTLLATPGTYAIVQSNLAATPPLNQFLDTSATGGLLFFYLIELQE